MLADLERRLNEAEAVSPAATRSKEVRDRQLALLLSGAKACVAKRGGSAATTSRPV